MSWLAIVTVSFQSPFCFCVRPSFLTSIAIALALAWSAAELSMFFLAIDLPQGDVGRDVRATNADHLVVVQAELEIAGDMRRLFRKIQHAFSNCCRHAVILFANLSCCSASHCMVTLVIRFLSSSGT